VSYVDTVECDTVDITMSGTLEATTDGLSTTSYSPSRGRDYALIRYKANSGKDLNYRPLFSLSGATSGKTWDFGINPRHSNETIYSSEDITATVYTDELFLYAFSATAYGKSTTGSPSFSLGIGRKWSSNYTDEDGETAHTSGYNYIIPRTKIKLGTPNFPWYQFYATRINGTKVMAEDYSTVSDKRLKIVQSNINLSKLINVYDKLMPIAFKYKNVNEKET
jgi:hypothetical protein